MKLYQKKLSDIYHELNTDPTKGLTTIEAQQRLHKFGNNELKIEKAPSIFYIFFLQFADPLIYLLLTAAGIIFVVGQSLDAFIIGGILIFNAIIGTIQEKRTEKILDSLQNFFTSQSIAIRDGLPQIITSNALVPGDIIRLSAGEKVPADARIIIATNATIDESMLTGESVPVHKFATESISQIKNNKNAYDFLSKIEIAKQDQISVNEGGGDRKTFKKSGLGPLASTNPGVFAENVGPDKNSIIFSGTHVVSGQITAAIFATGKNTEIGKIHTSIENINTNTPLKQELETLAHWILMFVFVICASLFTIGIITHKPIVDLLVMLTALFICVVPEGLPVIMTLVLISGAYKMAQRNVLVKQLKAVEALGRVNVIITDKTGTLTRNEMVVSNVFVDNQNLRVSGSGYFAEGSVENQTEHQTSLDAIATACALSNDTTMSFDAKSNKFDIKGDPTQAAAFIFAQKVSPSMLSLSQQITPIYTIPFDSAYRYKAVFYKKNESTVVSVLGAPEVILAACNNNDEKINVQLKKYLAQGYRVIAVAHKIYSQGSENSFADYQTLTTSNLTFLGLLAISDEPRENLSTIIKQVDAAGIQIIMATGDHPETALHIAKQVGIVANDKNIITGQDFAQLSDQQAIQLFQQNNFVCARFSPLDKLRLVQLFHQQKKIVATTGDGMNDVPALVASDISIAMGSTGTQLTKQASDIILLQDSFENIIYAIQQGRNMFHALRRTVLYFLTSNMGEVLIIFFALIMNLPLPLLPAQILWLNLITDGFLDVALAMESEHDTTLLEVNHKKTHQSSPKKGYAQTSGKIFDSTIIYKMFYLSIPMSLIGLVTFMSLYKTDIALARTLTLVTLAMFQWFNAFNCRSENKSIFTIGIFSNFWLIMASITVFLLQLLVLYTPFMQKIFRTVPLSLHHWGYAVGVSCSVLIMEEIRKCIARRFYS